MQTILVDAITRWCYDNDINPDSLYFVSDSQDVEPIKEIYPAETEDYDSFYVVVGDGEYLHIWGMEGIIPYNYKTLYKLV